MIKCIGIDPSFSGTGWWVGNSSQQLEEGGCIRFGAKGMGERLAQAYRFFNQILDEHRPDIACIEGYAMGQRGRREVAGELGGVIRLSLYQKGIEGLYIVPPSTLKLYTTGNGRASKEEMVAAVADRWGWDCGKEHDQADALALARAGIDMWEGNAPGCDKSSQWVVL